MKRTLRQPLRERLVECAYIRPLRQPRHLLGALRHVLFILVYCVNDRLSISQDV